MADQQFCLRWSEHRGNLVKVFKQMLDSQAFVDVTLACEGRFIKAHKMILAACSAYLNNILEENTSKHPIIFLPHLKYNDIKALVDYMYCGEVYISFGHLPSLLKAAEVLRIKGLSDVTNGNISNSDSPGTSATLDRDNRAISNRSQQVSPPINLQDSRLFGDISTSTMQQHLAIIMGSATNGFQQLASGESNDNMENLPASKKRRLRPSANPRSRKNIIATMQGGDNSRDLEEEEEEDICEGAGPSSGANDRYSVDMDRLTSPKVKGDPDATTNDCDIDQDDLHDCTNNNDSVLDNDEQDWNAGLSHHYDEEDDYEQSHLPINPEVSFDDCSTGEPANEDESNGESQNKTFVCHLCRLTFTAQSSLRRHMHRHFTDRERFECEICHNSYSRKDYLKEHKKTKHQIQS